jgi:transcriptional regulator with XRE-family HTH domain
MNRHNHDYTVDLLLKEFDQRKLKNSRYSLRAYARDLGVDSSFLSKVLRGKRILGYKVAEDMRKRLSSDGKKSYSSRSQFKAL